MTTGNETPYTNDTDRDLEVTFPLVTKTSVTLFLAPGETLTADRVEGAIASVQRALDNDPIRGRDASAYFHAEGVPNNVRAAIWDQGEGEEFTVDLPEGVDRKADPTAMERLLKQAFQVERAAYDAGADVNGADMVDVFGMLRRQARHVLTGEGEPCADWEALFEGGVDLDVGITKDADPEGPVPTTP